MTRSRSGIAMANWSLSSEKAVNPSGAVIFGAPDDREELDDLELLEREELDRGELDDELLVADAFFLLPSSLVAKNTIAPMIATAATTMAMIGPVPSPDRDEPGAGPAGPGVGVGVGVGSGSVAPNGCVGGASAGAAGACSGGYHLPSDACHQPGPCD